MSNEYIHFLKPLSWERLVSYIDDICINYSFSSEFITTRMYKGISDGRFAEAETICFVDREPTNTIIQSLTGALVITTKELHKYFSNTAAIYTKDPRVLFIKLIDLFEQKKVCSPFTSQIKVQVPTINPESIIDDRAILEDGVSVGKGSVISAGTVLKRGTVIGENCIIRENCTIGCNGIALYKTLNNETLRFPHLAGVNIGNNVELGASTVIVRGTLTNTVVDNDTVIGNLCNIGHGVKIGKKVWLSVGGLIGGNCIIEDHVTMGLGIRLKDNLLISEGSTIGMGSVVTKSLKAKTTVFGNPAKSLRPLKAGPKR